MRRRDQGKLQQNLKLTFEEKHLLFLLREKLKLSISEIVGICITELARRENIKIEGEQNNGI